jgi:hypothetical protein
MRSKPRSGNPDKNVSVPRLTNAEIDSCKGPATFFPKQNQGQKVDANAIHHDFLHVIEGETVKSDHELHPKGPKSW